MNIQQLHYVLEVHRLRSISAASKELYISQPSLSNAIKQLEDELDIQIFERNHRGVVATPDGMDLIQKAEALVSQFNALGERYKNRDNVKKNISIVTMPCVQSEEAFKILCRQYKDDAEIDFSLTTSSGNKTLISVASNDADLGLVYFSKIQMEEYLDKVDYHGLEFMPLAILKTYICINEDDKLAKRDKICLDDIKDYAIVCNRTSMFLDTVNVLLRCVEPTSDMMQYEKTISTNSKQLNYELVKCTKAFCLGTSLDIYDLKKLGVASVPTTGDIQLTMGYIKKKNKDLTPMAKHYLNILSETLVLSDE